MKKGKRNFSRLFLLILFATLVLTSQIASVSANETWDTIKSYVFGYDSSTLSDFRSKTNVTPFFGDSNQFSEEYIEFLFIIIWIMVFVSISDIMSNSSLFKTWVAWVLGLGVTIITARVGFMQWLAYWGFSIAGGLGTIGIVFIIILSVVIAVLVHFGSAWAANLILRLRYLKMSSRAAEKGDRVKLAIENLGKIGEGMAK